MSAKNDLSTFSVFIFEMFIQQAEFFRFKSIIGLNARLFSHSDRSLFCLFSLSSALFILQKKNPESLCSASCYGTL